MPREFTDIVALLVLPPAGPLLLLALGFVVQRGRRRRLGVALGLLGFAALWLTSLGIVGTSMIRLLEPPPATAADLKSAAAIVVLGAARIHDSPEYAEDVPSAEALVRLRYAARLARETGLLVLVAGGKPYGGSLSEGETMARVLKRDFNTAARWIEDQSATTSENAVRAYAMLQPEGRTRIALVTSALHMSRAQRAFAKAGFEVVAAPTGYVSRRESQITDWVPSVDGLYATRVALWELLGMVWYRLKGAG